MRLPVRARAGVPALPLLLAGAAALAQPAMPVGVSWRTIGDETRNAKSLVRSAAEPGGTLGGRIGKRLDPAQAGAACQAGSGGLHGRPVVGLPAPAGVRRADGGEFDGEITPDRASGEVSVGRRIADRDDGPRRGTSAESLAALGPAFAAEGPVTAGNSSQTSGGAGCPILASESAVKRFGLTPLARFAGYAVEGVPPEPMGIGPVEAVPAALRSAGIGAGQRDRIELDQAFAAQALAVIDAPGLDRAKVDPFDGAIALGHPLGATGAVRAATLVHALRRRGMVTMCVGTGQGAAGVFERV